VEELTKRVELCDVLLAVIGKSWLMIADGSGRPRIKNPTDYVAIEIGTALRRGAQVIPILVNGGKMPMSSELPETLAPLAQRQAHDLPDKGFLTALEKLFPLFKGSSQRSRQGGQLATIDGPIVQFEYTVEPYKTQLSDKLKERYVVLENTGQMDAFDLDISEIANGEYSWKTPVIQRVAKAARITIPVDVDRGPNENIHGGMMLLLGAERDRDIPRDRLVETTTRRIPVTLTYRDVLNRHYKTVFEIEYSYIFPSARTFFIKHDRLD